MGETHGICDKVMYAHGYSLKPSGVELKSGLYYEYCIAKPADTVGDSFLPERHLIIRAWHPKAQRTVILGHLGIPRHEVCKAYKIVTKVVVSLLEMNLHFFL